MVTSAKPKRRRSKVAMELQKLLGNRTRNIGSVYKLTDTGIGYDILTEPEIDAGAMSATAVINTPLPDRDDEVILPSGVRLDNYTNNPVVLWEHGFGGIDFPIAKSETPGGQLAVTVGSDAIEATSYFTNRVRESEQVFALIEEGIVRATSIHVTPDPGTAEVKTLDNGHRITVFPSSEMLEWSWGAIGVNPEAVRKVFDRGRLAGSSISESLAKTLRPYAATTRAQGVGFDLSNLVNPNQKAKSMDISQLSDEEREKLKAELMADEPEDKEKMEDVDEEKMEDVEEEKMEEANEPPAGDVEADSPPSARVLAAAHASLSDLVANIEGAANQYENPDVKAYFEELVADLQSKIAEIDGLHSQVAGKPAAKMEEEESDEDAVKSWLTAGAGRGWQLTGYGSRLASLSAAKNLTPQQRKTVAGVVTGLKRIVSTAKSRSSSDLANQVGELKKMFATINEKIQEAIPAT